MDLDLDMQKWPSESKILYYFRLAEHLSAPFLWSIAIYFAYSLPRVSLVHRNLRIILSCCPIAILASTTSHLLFINLVKFCENKQNEWTTELLYCIVAFVHLTSCSFAATLIFCVVLERLRATMKQREYENSSTSFGIFLCCQSLASGIFLALFIMFYDILNLSKTDQFYKYRYSFELHPLLGLICYSSAGISTTCSAILMYKLYTKNKMLNLRTRGVVPLSSRYQNSENVQSLRTLTPIISMYAFCTVFGSVLVVLRQIRFNKAGASDLIQMIYLQSVYLSMDLFVAIGVPFMLLNYLPLRNLLVSDIKYLFGLKSTQTRTTTTERFYQKHAPQNEGTIYFNMLEKSWM